MTLHQSLTAILLATTVFVSWRWEVAKHDLAAFKSAALVQEQANRAKTRLYAERAERLTHERQKLQVVHARITGSLRDDADSLREQIAGYAGQAGGDSCAASVDRATTLGELLADSVQLQAELAGAAESHLADARTLQEWANGLACR